MVAEVIVNGQMVAVWCRVRSPNKLGRYWAGKHTKRTPKGIDFGLDKVHTGHRQSELRWIRNREHKATAQARTHIGVAW